MDYALPRIGLKTRRRRKGPREKIWWRVLWFQIALFCIQIFWLVTATETPAIIWSIFWALLQGWLVCRSYRHWKECRDNGW